MTTTKIKILDNICYTELVYGRINKKLKSNYSKPEIEQLILDIINETPETFFQKIGKNYYITNDKNNIKITVNSNTYRVITVDRTIKEQPKI
ncbi:MAG TPA: DUF3781 domain-containing protein [Flavobacterium sp.]|nr:DUF3781 domain-containing protein [Flavobacterium sp.]